MKRKKLLLALILLLLGFIGVLSLLTSGFSVENLPPEVLAMFSQDELRYLMLVNPAVLTIIAVIAGTLVLDRTGLTVPFLESLIQGSVKISILLEQLKWGIPLGLITGIFLYFFASWFEHMLPGEFALLAADFEPSIAMKLLYGGICEEILLRFGLMTVFVCLAVVLFKKLNPAIYWSSIVLAAILFGMGHLGVLFKAIDAPSVAITFYVLAGNSIAGIVLGWLYWKKGLEASMIGHVCMHLSMIILLGIIG